MRRLIVALLVLAACSPTEPLAEPGTSTTTSTTTSATTSPPTASTVPPSFSVTSPAFDSGEPIPPEYTCDGSDVSPELNIVGIPPETVSLVMIVDDPDASLGVWDHWVEFDIVPDGGSLSIERATGPVGVPGVNSWNLSGYMGPCPPAGEEHEYHFEVYALDRLLDLPEGVPSSQVYPAMDGGIISGVELIGTYSRSEG
jgi:Raf kinase inhibitor-like YbhB/YbcL family protein